MKKQTVEDLNSVLKWSSVMGEIDINKISDGKNTFEELYKQRTTLLAVTINSYPELSWKTNIKDETFDVYINTPQGATSFNIDEKYWEFFNILVSDKEIEVEEKESIDKLLSLVNISNYTKNKVRERK